MRYYSTTGDSGTTSFGRGIHAQKSELCMEFIGALDEAQAALGFAASEAQTLSKEYDQLCKVFNCLTCMQRLIFEAGTVVMETTSKELAQKWSWSERLAEAERLCEQFAPKQALRDFVLPGGSELAARIELARVAIRRLERVYCRLTAAETEVQSLHNLAGMDALPLFNRLSSLAFVLARYSNEVLEVDELSL